MNGAAGGSPEHVPLPELEEALARFLPGRRWFGDKSRPIGRVRVDEAFALEKDIFFLVCGVEFAAGEERSYALPVMTRRGGGAPPGLLLQAADGRVWFECSADEGFGRAMFRFLADGGRREGRRRALRAALLPGAEVSRGRVEGEAVRLLDADQSNSSLILGESLILKLYRRLDAGVNPEAEMLEHLTSRAGFRHSPPLAGVVELVDGERGTVTAGCLCGFVPNQGTAWSVFGRELKRLCSAGGEIRAGGFLGAPAELMGRRTAQMHCALSAAAGDPDFEPEPLTSAGAARLRRAIEERVAFSLKTARDAGPRLAAPIRAEIGALLEAEGEIMRRIRRLEERPFGMQLARAHGDLHLGQVLCAGGDFCIIDFEGEPARAAAERRQKCPVLRDVAGMLRSFHYAAHVALASQPGGAPDSAPRLEEWRRGVSRAYTAGYMAAAGGAPFLPQDPAAVELLLEVFMFEKAAYELAYEISCRPEWIGVPLAGLRGLLEEGR